MSLSPKPSKLLFFLILGLSILISLAITWTNGFGEESVRMNIRWTARVSLICFCLAFISSSLLTLKRNNFTLWLVTNRRYFGILFAIIHLIHFLFVFLLHQYFTTIFAVESIGEFGFGGLAYVFLVLMLLTSFSPFKRMISMTNWNRLHKIGSYWILIVFSFSMIGRMVFGKLEYIPFAFLIIVVWLVRLLAWRNRFQSESI